jgi:hypothetical protein
MQHCGNQRLMAQHDGVERIEIPGLGEQDELEVGIESLRWWGVGHEKS